MMTYQISNPRIFYEVLINENEVKSFIFDRFSDDIYDDWETMPLLKEGFENLINTKYPTYDLFGVDLVPSEILRIILPETYDKFYEDFLYGEFEKIVKEIKNGEKEFNFLKFKFKRIE